MSGWGDGRNSYWREYELAFRQVLVVGIGELQMRYMVEVSVVVA